MKLEEEIRQTKPFKSEFQKLVLNICFTSSWLNNLLAEGLKSFDLTLHQYNVLRILKGRYPDSYCNLEIAQRMIDKSSNATRIVDKLLEKKLAIRSENADDRRHVVIKITDKGIKLLNEIESPSDKVELKFKDYNLEKARLMNEWLDELRG
jgi:DNA-binding MarR family transcriptional regulator